MRPRQRQHVKTQLSEREAANGTRKVRQTTANKRTMRQIARMLLTVTQNVRALPVSPKYGAILSRLQQSRQDSRRLTYISRALSTTYTNVHQALSELITDHPMGVREHQHGRRSEMTKGASYNTRPPTSGACVLDLMDDLTERAPHRTACPLHILRGVNAVWSDDLSHFAPSPTVTRNTAGCGLCCGMTPRGCTPGCPPPQALSRAGVFLLHGPIK